jgi:peptidoglycan hydrolase-like protein with peptidoglycan-binding domain
MTADTVLGTTGTTGSSTGIHLHLGVKRIGNTTWVDPMGIVFTVPDMSVKPPVDPPAKVNPYREPVNEVIKAGSKGEGVKWVQWWLNEKGYDLGKWGIDGDFGKTGSFTDRAVRKLQTDRRIAVDGQVGAQTRGELKK